MNKKKIGEKTDSLLEAEMIKEAKMIEESLLGNAVNDFEISDEELGRIPPYQYRLGTQWKEADNGQ